MNSTVLLHAVFLFMCFRNAKCIECYQCDSGMADASDCNYLTDKSSPDLKSKSCSSIPNAKFCVKKVAQGGLGTKRFCSALDMGNYCNYVKQPGVDREYRSCVYTCDSDGCNSAHLLKPVNLFFFSTILISLYMGTI
nr:PREDICTED: omega-scoloptoxin-Ssm1a-like isoform X1 [Bemisia tabaci]